MNDYDYEPESEAICPACINDFLLENSINDLGTELADYKDKYYCYPELCEDHKNRNFFEENSKVMGLIDGLSRW